jgi:hypothetical protein
VKKGEMKGNKKQTEKEGETIKNCYTKWLKSELKE